MKRGALVALLALPLLGASSTAPVPQAGISFHGGDVLTSPVRVFPIWYGDWSKGEAKSLVTSFLESLGGSSYFQILSTYANGAGTPATSTLKVEPGLTDAYSAGRMVTEAALQRLLTTSVSAGKLPKDSSAIYLILAAPDVSLEGHCSPSCSVANRVSAEGTELKYIVVGAPSRCNGKCAGSIRGPHADAEADALVALLPGALANVITNPHLNGWFDTQGKQVGEKCAGTYGAIYSTKGGGKANLRLGGHDWLVPQLWVNRVNGYCAKGLR